MTLLKNPSPSVEIADVAESTREFLESLCREPETHGRFLNTLSLLEHIGSRKIMLTRGKREMPVGILRHLSEEARHAHFFRRAAEKIGGRSLGYERRDLLAPAESRMYFGRLDALVTREAGEGEGRAYRYVSLMIEIRADWLYRMYEEVLRRAETPLSLKSVLAEEEGHLAEMESVLAGSDPFYESRRRRFAIQEAKLYAVWLSAVRKAKIGG